MLKRPDYFHVDRDHVGAMYEEILNARAQAGNQSAFINYGYADETSPRPTVDQADRLGDPYSRQLLHEVIGSNSLEGAAVLEVGCGRGGNLALIAQQYKAASIHGLDISIASTEHAKANSPTDTACTYVVGDAERLPYANDTFDVVLNLESAMHYRDLRAFFACVANVLRPGGLFLYADILPVHLITPVGQCLARLGYRTVSHRDLTKNVILSLETRYARRPANDWNASSGYRSFRKNIVYEQMKHHELSYVSFTLSW